MSHTFEIKREVVLEATPEEVFAAVTTGIAGWMFPVDVDPGAAAPGAPSINMESNRRTASRCASRTRAACSTPSSTSSRRAAAAPRCCATCTAASSARTGRTSTTPPASTPTSTCTASAST